MTAELRIKVWEHDPISFASFREKVMAFCYENNVAPDDLMIAPYTEMDFENITQMGFEVTIIKRV